ncbi:MAG: dihydrolipoyl dehydrogenase [Candidatus Aenigmarchaeota archaeon]|nr:dihydrolipoyl dehydrogenase [Candidatus Aenigmarchaeota archaeon]
MDSFDVIVIGAGSGLNVAAAAASKGLRVALVDDGPMGGTCLNRGCIPSKMILHAADIAEQMDHASVIGVLSKGHTVQFANIINRASREVDHEARDIEAGIKQTKNMTLFKARARFVAPLTLVVGSKTITGKKIIIAAGTRPTIPSIPGIEKVNYLTSDDALRLAKQPKRIVILGGGFIAAELAYFYHALGTDVTVIQRSVLLRQEDREIADAFTKIVSKKYTVLLGYEISAVKQTGKTITLTIVGKNNKKQIIKTDALLVATGRTPNTDVLDVAKGDVAVDERGYVRVNDFLETSAPNTWALGDIVGKYLFKHSANLEASYAIVNALDNRKETIDYWPMPHAIFSSPQIAAVGYTEEELKQKEIPYAIGRYEYKKTGMGLALAEKDGFVKILADKNTHEILGCHILGPDAATLIHEVIIAMKARLPVEAVAQITHIHPALSEVVQRAAANIEW